MLRHILDWQRVAQFEFGPAEKVFLRNSLNNFPLNEEALEINIQSESFNADNPETYDKGFPALDYLLYKDDFMTTLAFYQSPTAELHKRYLTKVINDIHSRIAQTYKGWMEGYADTFINNTGTAAGSALSLIINNLNQNYELIKREKIGIPSGVLTLGFQNPKLVEAYYSGLSVHLATAALKAAEDLYLGKSEPETNGTGLDDYLQQIGVKKEDQFLDELIQQQFQSALIALSELKHPISEEVEHNQSAVQTAYNENH